MKCLPHRSIWVKPEDPEILQIIDQRFLPHELVIEDITSLDQTVQAIKDMHVRGAPLIGVTAAYGIYLALLHAPRDFSLKEYLVEVARKLRDSRPTAVNLEWAIRRMLKVIAGTKTLEEKIRAAFETANQIAEEDVAVCRKIGEYGLPLIREISKHKKGEPVNILTHCNAGWLACVEWGTATAPFYLAFEQGIAIHVWVDETRPRNQGASLTAWELLQRGIPHTVIADSTSGHLMQHGRVDLILVGTDRTAVTGDVTNKIGTYMLALAAKDNQVPFYAAVPSSSIDWAVEDSFRDIPIEERSPEEVKYVRGLCEGKFKKVLVMPQETPAKNYAFDITPRRFLTGLITERGICQADRESLFDLFPEKKPRHLKDEGVIKFHCHWTKTGPLAEELIKDLNHWRNRFYDFGLIGMDEDRVGFGNISLRVGNGHQFIISGTQTGGIPRLHAGHYTQVLSFDLDQNRIDCQGPTQASSESLTHARLYQLSPEINAVIHGHHRALWKKLLNQVPTTSKDVPYGTPEMAREVKRLFEESALKENKIFVMAGHEEGIVAFGKDLAEAAAILSGYVHKFILGILILFCFASSVRAEESKGIEVGAFSKMTEEKLPPEWLEVRFQDLERHTAYFLVKEDRVPVVKAISQASASGIGRELNIQPRHYPILHWRWKVENLVEKSDLKHKSGDDYAARIYVAFDHDSTALGFFEKILFRLLGKIYHKRIPARALSYIWSKNASVGTMVSNPYTKRVKMIVVQAGSEGLNEWHEFNRNIYADYQKAFGKKPPLVKGIGMMTDTDTTGESVTAYYGDISLESLRD